MDFLSTLLISTALSAQTSPMAWSSSGPIPGMSCTQVYESREPAHTTWDDNYLCTPWDIGLRYASDGPISGMSCTQLHEPRDLHAWDNNNYLCLPRSSPLALVWSSNGPIPDMRCTQLHEPRDPYTWDDNYLCIN
jgi:serine protease